MAAPSYATDLNDIYTDTDNFSAVGGGRITAVETDDFIQGSNCWSHDPFSSGIEGGMHTSTETVAADDAVYVWMKCDVAATLATHAAGGMQVIFGSSITAYDCWYVRGSDDYQYGGWICVPVDPTLTPSTTVGTPGTYSMWGVRWNVPGTGASKGYPMKIDAMRHGRQLEITAGDSGTPATWDSVAAYDSATIRQWGICQPTNSGAAIQGLVYWGTASASVYSRDSNRTIAIIDTEWTATDFTQILFAHASNDVVWDNVGLLALGTANRGIIDITANGTVTWTNSVFQGIDTTTMLAGSTFDGSKWLSCNEVDAGGGSLLNAKILTPTVATSSHSLLWNVATDPDGSLDGMEFSKGTNAHHAINFGTTSPISLTLRGCSFSGFNASDTNNDSALYVARTAGTVTINLVGCTGDISYQSAGATVVLVQDPVTTTITVRHVSTGALIQDARVYLIADTGGPLTAGTVIFNELTTATGVVSDTRSLASAQPVTGWVRKGSAAPYYKQTTLTGSISNTSGLTVTALMIPDS